MPTPNKNTAYFQLNIYFLLKLQKSFSQEQLEIFLSFVVELTWMTDSRNIRLLSL